MGAQVGAWRGRIRARLTGAEYIDHPPEHKGQRVEIVLASTSPWRRKILEDIGFSVRVVPSHVDEKSVVVEGAEALALELAWRKASAVVGRFEDHWVIGADQVVEDGERVYGKPADPTEHRDTLLSMRGRTHTLVTGVAVLSPRGERRIVARTRMRVRSDLTPAEIDAYVATGEGSGCAGGYAAEGLGGMLFADIDGEWFNVLGLPLLGLLDVLRADGWRYGSEGWTVREAR